MPTPARKACRFSRMSLKFGLVMVLSGSVPFLGTEVGGFLRCYGRRSGQLLCLR